MVTQLEAIEKLQKEYDRSDIVLAKAKDKKDWEELHDIAKTFEVSAPVEEFIPNIDQGKYSCMPHHTEECVKHWGEGTEHWEAWNKASTGRRIKCPCWDISLGLGIALTSLVDVIANKYDVHVEIMGRGYRYRAQLEQIKKKVEQETIHVTTGKWVTVPLNGKRTS